MTCRYCGYYGSIRPHGQCGAGIGQCGAYVHLNGEPIFELPGASESGRGIDYRPLKFSPGSELHAFAASLDDKDVAQCGYCQSGQLMSPQRVARNAKPSDADIDAAMVAIIAAVVPTFAFAKLFMPPHLSVDAAAKTGVQS